MSSLNKKNLERMLDKIEKMDVTWYEILKEEFSMGYMQDLHDFLSQEEKSGYTIYPPKSSIFNAFCHFSLEDTKVVIVGQDPYHNPDQAHGLCFSIKKGVRIPPSLKNIYKEIHEDLDILPAKHGFLEDWTKQGVLLLNATLTVRKNQPKSHFGKGWEKFTDHVLKKLYERTDPLVFVLWGKFAQEKCKNILVGSSVHFILQAAHPSPFSAANGFFGCKHFSKINEFLVKNKKLPIQWKLTE